MNKDLSVGKPLRVLWLYTLPLLGSVIFQQLYNLADSVIAGRFLGETALAAVGNAAEIAFIYTAFAFGCNVGCSVVISQLFGAKRFSELKTAVYTSFLAFGAMCLLLMGCGFAFTQAGLKLMNTPDDIMPYSLVYLNIYTAGTIFVFLYNIATGIFSAMGDSKTPLYLLAFSSLSNIGVDILFVTSFHMGVAGVAWATFLCQGISCVLALLLLFKRLSKLPVNGRVHAFSGLYFKKTLRIAIPSILQQWSISFGNIVVQSLINACGSGVIAGFTAASKLNIIATSVYTACANGVSTYTAQNIGAGKTERINPGFVACLKMGFLCTAVFLLCYNVFSGQLIGLFISQSSEAALNAGKLFLHIVSPFYLAVSVKIIADGILRGSGAVHLFMITTVVDLALRVLAAFLFSAPFGFAGICWAWPVGWLISTGLAIAFYLKGSWKKATI